MAASGRVYCGGGCGQELRFIGSGDQDLRFV